MNIKHILLPFLLGCLPTSALALTLSQSPLFISSIEQRVMLTISRDHQLSIKAYTDYSDLDGDGSLDTTYNDGFSYYGYFDSEKCYAYSSSRFEPSAAVTANTHQCNGSTWSGNFLNWATMTRMDVLRKALFGGYRSTDEVGASYVTVLERQFLPVDVHAFVKVYIPTGTMPSIASLTGISGQTSVSLCNVSDTTSTTLTGLMTTLPDPLIKVAAGSWPQWDSSEVTQCAVNIGNNTQPTALLNTYNARIKVCTSGSLESNCKTYTHPTDGTRTIKPTGLLQQYGDVDAERRVRFGLMTGSYAANKSGGVLRKNAGFITNNQKVELTNSNVCGNNNNLDEIDACTGQFINQENTKAGIINTLNRLRIAGFQYTSGGRNNKYGYSCGSPGKPSFINGECVDWGNPLGETYLETLRYFANAGATSAFNVSDASKLSAIPAVTWSDPLPLTEWCALSSIVVLSTGLNSFDTNELTSFTPSGGGSIDPASLTNLVGTREGISGNYLIGDNGTDNNKQCTAKSLTNLSDAKGICPEVPSTEGGYGIAGLAYAPKTIDLRPSYATQRGIRWGTINPDWVARQPISTYTVQLAETLPSFDINVDEQSVTLLPACQANSNKDASAWPTSADWRNCSMTNLIVDKKWASSDVGVDTTAQTKTCGCDGTNFGCFTVAWEDSTWGNDYDMDGIQRLGYCVGSACDTFKMLCPTTSSANATIGPWTGTASNKIVIATCAIQANAGHALTFGYTIAGTLNDRAYFPILRPGGDSYTFSVGQALKSGVTEPDFRDFTQGTSSAKLLKNPLWYAAKYGSFAEPQVCGAATNNVPNQRPDLSCEWDTTNNVTGVTVSDGEPDNYFDIRNPANLITALSKVFDKASQPDASAASVATNSTSLKTDSRVFQAKFSSADWSGQLLSYHLDTDDDFNLTEEWDAGLLIPTPANRVILTKGATDGIAFTYANLIGPTETEGTQQYFLDTVSSPFTTELFRDDCGLERVAYLRGDTTNEGTGGAFTCASGSYVSKFRARSVSKLGDIVNSSPWYVGAPSAGYSDVDHPAYSAFRRDNLTRKPVVYVGSNDGMLHGFDASLTFSEEHPEGIVTATSGQEVLAYIPSAVFPNLNKLTTQTYNKNHFYFVDGSPMVGDANLGTPPSHSWRTVLVGAMGAGGKGYYALDVTDPSSFSESGTAPANTLLWEFNEADDVDMGYAFNMPPAISATHAAKQIVKIANGKWAAIVGNGYNTSLGKAVLYVIFINEGIDGTWTEDSDYVKIVAEVPEAFNNGLSTPVPFDSNEDGYADTVYAGDLKGNLWKFLVGPNGSDLDVTDDPATWKVAFSTSTCASSAPSTCQALFTATDNNSGGNPQPIIWPPEVTMHPEGGQMVLFGTGKYIEPSDNDNTALQTFYGIWDRHDGSTQVARSDLLQQTVTGTQAVAVRNYRVTSANPIDWRPSDCSDDACDGTHMGWYMNLPTSKERTTGIPKRINGVIFFNTLIPSITLCDPGTGWLMSLDFLSGGLVNTHRVFDTNNDFSFNESDIQVGGYQVGAAPGGTTLIQNTSSADSSNIGLGVSSLVTGILTTTSINFGAQLKGRLNWREIVQ